MPDTIPFIDLLAQRERIGDAISDAMARVIAHGRFILGPEVAELEGRLADFCGIKHCITCANGTDALVLLLMAEDIGPGDAVFVPAFTFVATAEAVRLTGATPVFCDVHEDTFNLDAQSIEKAVPLAMELNLRPRAIIPVDLFGQPADYSAIENVAEIFELSIISDAAQSFGAEFNGIRTGGFGKATAMSFFPAKPLGCYGDGGAITTNDDTLAERIRSLRMHGQGAGKYHNVRVGLNSRLDTLQAAVLLQKLTIFEDELEKRQEVATRYTEMIGDDVSPTILDGVRSSWAQYTIVDDDRDALASRTSEAGIPTAIYYPKSLNAQEGYFDCPVSPSGVPVSERLAGRVLSLPMHPYLDAETQERIVSVLLPATHRKVVRAQ